VRRRPHSHLHVHGNGTLHAHTHAHQGEHAHVHQRSGSLTAWVLFVVFVLGPCEPLIPLLMYPAAGMGPWALVWIAGVSSLVTLATMAGVVLAASAGLALAPLGRLERHVHATAGATIALCGLAILLLGI
jgi:hypothetical protein